MKPSRHPARIEPLEARIAPALLATLDFTNPDPIHGFRMTGDESRDETGAEVQGIGDFNGDGFDDVIINTGDAEGTNPGVPAYVVFGSATPFAAPLDLGSLDGTAGFKISAPDSTNEFFTYVGKAGDINNDGYDDLVVGVELADGGGNQRGSAYVLFGKGTPMPATVALSALTGADGFRIDGVADLDRLGHRVGPAGDMNDDGIDDLVVNSNRAANFSGAAYVIFGKTTPFAATFNLSTLNGTNGFRILGPASTELTNPASLGDVNGDGRDDIGVRGLPDETNGLERPGVIYVVFGRSSYTADVTLNALNGVNGFRVVGSHDQEAISSIAAGDVNDDGFSDVIIGGGRLNSNTLSEPPAVYVVYGHPGNFVSNLGVGDLDGNNGFTLVGAGGEFAGTSNSVADMNGDGINDILVGADGNASGTFTGKMYVVFGQKAERPAMVKLSSIKGASGYHVFFSDTDADFGQRVSAAGDFNGDGLQDAIIGAPDFRRGPNDYPGAAFLVYGFRNVLSKNAKSATFLDIDGDEVTVTTSKGAFDPEDFHFGPDGTLEELELTRSEFTGTTISITAKQTTRGGNSFVNIGRINAAGVDLGSVTVAGDLGRLDAGTIGGNAKTPGLKSLTVQSMGLLGTSTQGDEPGLQTGVTVVGALGSLTVKNDLRTSVTVLSEGDGVLGKVTIGGSVVADLPLNITAEAGLGSMTVTGDIRTEGGPLKIQTYGALGTLTVKGSIAGANSNNQVEIYADGQLIKPTKGTDTAIKTITVTGDVEFTRIGAGVTNRQNADASIGTISVGGDWFASFVEAGIEAGTDLRLGTADDAKIVTGGPNDSTALFSTIGSFTVKGQAFGTVNASDQFGVVAEKILKAKVGTRSFGFTTNGSEAFFAAITGFGSGTESPVFDFTIRELGSTTPTLNFAGPDLTIDASGKSATFIDMDGDLVTVKRTTGTFVLADFNVATTPTGGGQFRTLTITPSPGGVATNVTITAKPGPDGGNGWVNLGELKAPNAPLGTVSIAGDLGQFSGGKALGPKPGTASLTVHSFRAIGNSTGASGDTSTFTDGIGSLTVGASVGAGGEWVSADKIGKVTVKGNFEGDIRATAGLDAFTLTGTFRDGILQSTQGAIGAVTIGGDLLSAEIRAKGQFTPPTKGTDLALKSLTVKGNVEHTLVQVGTATYADASIGAISIGRQWIASTATTGLAGPDGLFVTFDDDLPLGAGVTDSVEIISSIASVTIKGQALGTLDPDDHFGIIAEMIGKAQIGTAVFKLAKGPRNGETYDAAPTISLNVGASDSDFILDEFYPREVV